MNDLTGRSLIRCPVVVSQRGLPYVTLWGLVRMCVLDVRPGITDPASIKFRNENGLMEKAEDL